MRKEDQILFFKKLSFLTKSGLGVLESLTTIKNQTIKKPHIKIIDFIISDISNGKNLSDSLSKFPKVFDVFSINIINSGEYSGMLSQNLEYLSEELIKNRNLKRKILSAFIYPVVILLSTLFITLFLIIYLFPKIIPIFKSMDINLPISTKIIIFLSETLKENGVYLVIFIFIFGGIFYYLTKKNKKIKFIKDLTILKIPKINIVVKKYNLANTTRTMGLLLKSGLTTSEALEITKKISNNIVYTEEYKKMLTFIRNGGEISSYMKNKDNLFPNEISQIISIGEKTGNLPESLIYISESYELDIDEFTKNLTNLIEPFMMILMGAIVGFIAISIISPIYSITQNLQR